MNSNDRLSIKTLRVLSVEEITKAKSGHPGIALGAAPIIHTLYTKILNSDPLHDQWINRDRFILAAGHGSSLLYSVLHIAGFGLTKSDLESFRQYGSLTPGHPELHLTKGVDATSGPLGQGIPEGVGLAIAEEFLAAKFNQGNYRLIDHYTYVLCGDGDLQEGVTQEAISIAGHLGLKKLIVLYDSNDIQLDGRVDLSNTEKVKDKYTAAGWNYLLVKEGENTDAIEEAILKAKKDSDKPTIIEIKTVIGFGSAAANTSKAHGTPLSDEEVAKMRAELGGSQFEVKEDVYRYYRETFGKRGMECYNSWETAKEEYSRLDPDLYRLFDKMIHDAIDIDFGNLIHFDSSYNKATRVASGEIINAISKLHPGFLGGSADLSSSTKARGADGDYSKTNRLGRNINFGVREHSMAAISNGIALHQGLKVFCSGFFVFSDYMKPAIRLACLMGLPVTYVFTHDSIAVGEDGPTHEPIEQLTMLRSIPNINVIRPADAHETHNHPSWTRRLFWV
jgi:transketolase